ncbi:MAG: adenylate/guanylate cyclase domain-containing protein, partial [Bdellovibrionota bacterium]
MSTRMFTDDSTASIQQTNIETATSLASQVRELIENLTEKMRILGTLQLQEQKPENKAQLTNEFFANDKDFLGVFLYHVGAGNQVTLANRAVSPEMANLGDADGAKALTALSQDRDFSLAQVAQGEIQIASVNVGDNVPAIALAVPFMKSATGENFTHLLTAFIKQTKFSKAFSQSDVITSFMVDRKGKLLAHTDASRVTAGENVAQLEVVKRLLEGKSNNGQTRYVDPATNEAKLGGFKVVGFAGLGVVSEVAEAKAFEAAQKVQYRSILFSIAVLCLSFLIGYLYSGTITWPIKQLMEAARRISQGDFKVALKPKGRDEVAELSHTVNEMAKGLEERDKVKETFNKFHNKEIAEKLLSGEVKLGGERKEATIFFSDVRGFTSMSESMEPEQVVEMLNEYMTRMVSIIRAHGGIVDKYVGDAIMALWGIPLSHGDDTYQAVRACLAMRQDLAELNELRKSRGQPVLRIGMGLNCGPVIAGNIGSNEKMEYTV